MSGSSASTSPVDGLRTSNVRSLTGLPSAGRRSRLPNRSGDLRWRIKGGSSGNVDFPKGSWPVRPGGHLLRTCGFCIGPPLTKKSCIPGPGEPGAGKAGGQLRSILARPQPPIAAASTAPICPSDQRLVAPAGSACVIARPSRVSYRGRKACHNVSPAGDAGRYMRSYSRRSNGALQISRFC